MECPDPTYISDSPYKLLWRALTHIPISHYLWGLFTLILIVLYNFLEIHFFQDLLNGFRGQRVSLYYNSLSEIYHGVASKCHTLHGRYLTTPWLSSPHIQTTFLNFFGRPPVFSYRRQLFHLSDGGTIALDWLMPSDVTQGVSRGSSTITKDDTTPIVVVIPGLTSDSSSAYLKHLCFKIAKRGWSVVVSNHRGLGGVSITSDRFYNAGWTEDVRKVIDYLHKEYPRAPLFAVGTSIGANVLVKYLGEDSDNTYISGAVAICSPWDLLIGDRFICRRLIQRFYDKALAIGLQGYAQMHEPIFTRLADWEGIAKARSIRDFDNYATCRVGKFETVDTYYRHCSSASFVGNVSVPLLCISALDDPLCTREAIPWDECRANKNVVLATTQHGGHLAFFEGITGKNLWWVRALDEFLCVLHSSPYMHTQKKTCIAPSVPESLIDQGPYVNFTEDGMVSAVADEQTCNDIVGVLPDSQNMIVDTETEQLAEPDNEAETKLTCDTALPTEQDSNAEQEVQHLKDAIPVRRRFDRLSRQTKISMWLIAYVAVITTWPVLRSALLKVFKRKVTNVLPKSWMR